MSDDPAYDYDGDDPLNATRDLRREADEALKMYALKKAPATASDGSVFEDNMVLRIEVAGSDSPIILKPEGQIVVGRRDPLGNEIPDIDLNPYAGYQMGISRRHASLLLHNHRLDVMDMDSRNGTFLNNVKLDPLKPRQVQNGDEVRLGKMVLRLYFQRE
jgi:hypothetical protein